MPVDRCDARGRFLRNFRAIPRTEHHIKQRDDSSEQMQPVQRGENVKKTAARITGKKNSFDAKVAPREQLPANENNSESAGERPQIPEGCLCAARQLAASELNRHAAEQ